jgi:hypothetical protein
VPLFAGGAFDQSYNAKYQPITTTIPAGVTKVELVALITGHGWGVEAANCAEFCNHTHHFTINGHELVKRHDITEDETLAPPGLARNLVGCALQIPDGVVPNQAGTWIYGRGGWCPGQDVKPWVVDVTGDVVIGGENVITYRGLYHGTDYVPQPAADPNSGGFAARIDMASWLVYSRPGS